MNQLITIIMMVNINSEKEIKLKLVSIINIIKILNEMENCFGRFFGDNNILTIFWIGIINNNNGNFSLIVGIIIFLRCLYSHRQVKKSAVT
jgi:hypothetical protein